MSIMSPGNVAYGDEIPLSLLFFVANHHNVDSYCRMRNPPTSTRASQVLQAKHAMSAFLQYISNAYMEGNAKFGGAASVGSSFTVTPFVAAL
jgi:hypothetical protein